MKRILLAFLITLVSGAAVAGPTIVESGGYTFLPALKLTGTQGLIGLQSGGIFMGAPSVYANAGIAVGNLSSFGAVCSITPTAYSLANCSLYTQGLDTFINAPAASNVIVRISNATKATFGTAALLLPSGVDFQLTQGQKLTFDGATAAKYLSSDGTTLTITGLGLSIGSGSLILATGNSLATGAGNYTGISRGMPNGSSWPIPVVLFHTGTVGANTNGAETTLVQYTHANQFGNDADVIGRGWHIRAWGTFAANGNTKTVKLKFGPTATDITNGAFTGAFNGGSWELDCIILRTTGTSAQSSRCGWVTSSATPVTGVQVQNDTEATATLDWNITLTGTGTATNDIANAMMRTDFAP